MTQASLNRAWVVLLGSLGYALALGWGLYQLSREAPRLMPATAWTESAKPARGQLLSADGTPLAATTPEGKRVYPLGVSASQLVGFGEKNPAQGLDRGLEGLERDLEAQLSSGQSIRLTIDPVVQSLAEQALWKGIASSKSDWGTALVMETSTGKLLAVANGPAFDPLAPRKDPSIDVSWRNHAFKVALEPGSTIKPLTAAVLLEKGAATLDTRVEAPMYRKIDKWVINDVVQHPKVLSLRQVLKYSSNVGISKLAERVSKNTLYEYFSRLHFTDTSPLASTRVAEPQVRPVRSWGPVESANATFGQGFLITPLHLTAAFNALANDGLYVPPALTEGAGAETERVFRPEVARAIRQALTEGAVSSAKVPGYVLGGKSGTAQVVVGGRYSADVFTALFAGFVPSDVPKVTVVVVLYRPKGLQIYGALISAPVYREIAAGLLSYWGTPPRKQN
ncbi:MAG: penicillin-binding transpeptidase domain-containing protein [Deinococcus sp.]|nr:penicillin-binding transpeptidase domain-containing protein [Deinococcus sp.]MCL5965218.1 penicillin-binding transpeptidase domain-containing protein [Deinococcus sp.]